MKRELWESMFSLVSLVLSVSTRKSKKILEHRSGKIYFCLCNEISTPQPTFIVYSSPESINLLTRISARARAHFEGENERKRRKHWFLAWCCSGCRTCASRNKLKRRSVLWHWWRYQRCQQLLLCFFCEQERGREVEGIFLFFQKGFLRGSPAFCIPFQYTKNNKR